MIRIKIDEKKCLLGQGKECRNCIVICPMHVLGVRGTVIKSLRSQECIACHSCKGSCPGGLDVIQVIRTGPLEKLEMSRAQPLSQGLKVEVGRLTLPSPLIVASGPIGRCGYGWISALASGCAAVVTKTTTLLPWAGNPATRILAYGADSIVNCEGLPNGGAKAVSEEIRRFKIVNPGLLVIASLTAFTEEDLVEMTKLFEDAGADGIEIALGVVFGGCPNYRSRSLITATYDVQNPTDVFKFVNAVRRAIRIPIWIKLGGPLNIASACEEGGADALVVRHGSLRAIPLDPSNGKPLLSGPRGEGNLTGPYTKLPGIKVVAEMASKIRIPIIGNGGIATGQDVIDYFRAGASAVQLLTVIMRRGMNVVPKIISDVEAYLKEHRIEKLDQLRGETLNYLNR